jgi:hypothetical protein
VAGERTLAELRLHAIALATAVELCHLATLNPAYILRMHRARAAQPRGAPAVRPEQASRTPEPRRSLSDSDTGPAPQSIPFASRVRYLGALGARRRRTALGPRLLAAGPASTPSCSQSSRTRASYSFRRAAIVYGAARHWARRPADGNAYVHRQSEEAPSRSSMSAERLSLDARFLRPRPSGPQARPQAGSRPTAWF